MNKKMKAALYYATQLGWKVVPLHSIDDLGRCTCFKGLNCDSPGKHPRWHQEYLPHGLKNASDDEDQIRLWWSLWPDANIGILTGAASGFICLDVDTKPDKESRVTGIDSLNEIIQRHGELPITVKAQTGSGGLHILFKYPDWHVSNKIGSLGHGLDVKGDGGYIVAAPSIHKSGNPYQWMEGHSPRDTELADLPWWLVAFLKEANTRYSIQANEEYQGRIWTEYLVDLPIGEGQRNNELFRIGASMRAKGAGLEDIKMTLHAVNEKRCTSPLEDREVDLIAKSVIRYEAGTAESMDFEKKIFPMTDIGNAERLVYRHGKDLKYCATLGGWFIWNGMYWERDETEEIKRRAKETVRSIKDEAELINVNTEEKVKLKEKMIKFATASESKHRITAMIDLSKAEPGIPITHDQFDRDPWLFTVKNGTLNLKTGEFRQHRREDLITKCAPVVYDPNATCPRWMHFLQEIFCSDCDLIEFVQKAIGYSLTGSTAEQVMFFLFGGGANGKSTLINIIQGMMGDYSQQAPTSLLMSKQSEGVSNDVARLKGARFVTTVETEDGKRMAEALVKQITGGDVITARFLRQEFFEFKPEAKVFLCSNHKPIISGTDYAIWRRIHLIPFEVQIPPEKRDKKLPEKLNAELSGIFNWALEGCMKWQREGLKPPSKVVAATEEYKEEMDSLGSFIEECCVLRPTSIVAVKDLYQEYSSWCEENGEFPMKNRMFSKRLKERGFKQDRDSSGTKRIWCGIGLKSISDITDKSDTKNTINEKKQSNVFVANTKNHVRNVSYVSSSSKETAATVVEEWEEGEL